MAWPLKEITLEARHATDYIDVGTGTCWRIPLSYPMGETTYGEHYRHMLSPEFLASGRDYVILVRFPPGIGELCVDWKASEAAGGWSVSGELPTITVSPSINAIGANGYHGWIRDGVLTDDCEGRTYPEFEL